MHSAGPAAGNTGGSGRLNDKSEASPGLGQRTLAAVERIGNRLPDPAILFIALLVLVWLLSWLLSYVDWGVTDPRNGEPLVIANQLASQAMVEFFSSMVKNFAHFHPIGVVLVAMLGIGVAEHTGFINAGLRAMLGVTARWLLTPMLITVGIISHTAADAGYVLVIPLGGVIFYAAGRHPLAGIAAAFAGVSGGFSANFIPSAIDPMLQGITQSGAQIIDPDISLNPLNNFFFTATSSLLIIAVGWFLTDRVVEPRLAGNPLDEDLEELPTMHALEDRERAGLKAAGWAMLAGVLALAAWAWPGAYAVTLPVYSVLTLIFSPTGKCVRPCQ